MVRVICGLVLAAAVLLSLLAPVSAKRGNEDDSGSDGDNATNATGISDRLGKPVPQEAAKLLQRMLSNVDPHVPPGSAVTPPYVTKVRVLLY